MTSTRRVGVALSEPGLAARAVEGLRRGGLAAAELARRPAPAELTAFDVVVVDLSARVTSERATIAELRREHPALACVAVVLTCTSSGPAVRRALGAGFEGVLLQERIGETIAATVAAVRAGQIVVPRNHQKELARAPLSMRERQVLSVLVTGAMNCEIAAALTVTESTVKSHLASAFAKLGVGSRSDALDLLLDPRGAPSLALDLPAADGGRRPARDVELGRR